MIIEGYKLPFLLNHSDMRNITEYNYKSYYVIDRLLATSQKQWLANFKLNRLVTKTIKEHAKTKKPIKTF